MPVTELHSSSWLIYEIMGLLYLLEIIIHHHNEKKIINYKL